ncbi:MAG: HpcH/HpaI aldolase/citrate lyase family protein [Chloroflexia bacterium]
MRLVRTLLYVPGNRPNMLAKAPTLGADALILDLEDSVPLPEKEAARGLVAQMLPQIVGEGRTVFVRVNSPASGLCEQDIAAVVQPGLTGLCLPKVENVDSLRTVVAWMAQAEQVRGIAEPLSILVTVETALGVLKAYAIASADPRVVGLIFGGEDLALDAWLVRTEEATELLFARQFVALAARAAGVQPVDMVYTRIDDEEGLMRNTLAGRQMGYRAKQVIHPRQIPVVNRIFSPSEEELAEARRVVAAAAEAEREGRGAIALDGKMVDRPIVERARRLLELAALLEEKTAGH